MYWSIKEKYTGTIAPVHHEKRPEKGNYDEGKSRGNKRVYHLLPQTLRVHMI